MPAKARSSAVPPVVLGVPARTQAVRSAAAIESTLATSAVSAATSSPVQPLCGPTTTAPAAAARTTRPGPRLSQAQSTYTRAEASKLAEQGGIAGRCGISCHDERDPRRIGGTQDRERVGARLERGTEEGERSAPRDRLDRLGFAQREEWTADLDRAPVGEALPDRLRLARRHRDDGVGQSEPVTDRIAELLQETVRRPAARRARQPAVGEEFEESFDVRLVGPQRETGIADLAPPPALGAAIVQQRRDDGRDPGGAGCRQERTGRVRILEPDDVDEIEPFDGACARDADFKAAGAQLFCERIGLVRIGIG